MDRRLASRRTPTSVPPKVPRVAPHPLEFIPGADLSFEVVFDESWSGYEDSAYQFILLKNGVYYDLHGGTSCMSSDNAPVWDPFPVSEDEALAIMIEWFADEADSACP